MSELFCMDRFQDVISIMAQPCVGNTLRSRKIVLIFTEANMLQSYWFVIYHLLCFKRSWSFVGRKLEKLFSGILAWRDQPLVVVKMTSKGAGLNNFFSIGWISILFMVDRGHMKVLRKKCKFFPFSACTSACTLFCTSGRKFFSQNFGQNFAKIIKFWRNQAKNIILASWR